jgi:hypothetical protein
VFSKLSGAPVLCTPGPLALRTGRSSGQRGPSSETRQVAEVEGVGWWSLGAVPGRGGGRGRLDEGGAWAGTEPQ